MAAKILVVEDERIVALNVQRQLVHLGYEVPSLVASGEQALIKAADIEPDLVLMDIHIEGPMDGIQTAEVINNRYQIPIVFLTAYSEETTLQRACETHPFGYLLKPFSERELHATIQMALERRKTEAALQDSEERLRLALDAAELGTLEIDWDTHLVRHADRADRFFGFPKDTFDGSWQGFIERMHPEDQPRVLSALEQTMLDSVPYDIEFRGVHPNGAVRWLKAQVRAYPIPGGTDRRLIGVVQDVTDQHYAEEQLRQAARVFESTTEGIVVLDKTRRVVTVNQAFVTITGYSRAETVGAELFLLSTDAYPPPFLNELWSELNLQGQWRGELQGWRKDGVAFPAWTSLSAVKDSKGEIGHYVAVFSDISVVRQAAEKLKHIAHHDSLTDLPNRLLSLDRLDHALERARRRDRKVALLFIDLDRFKSVNDTMGHHGGDELLRIIAQRLQASLRMEDTAARLGGDEFLVILDQMENRKDIAGVAEKLISVLSEPALVAGRDVATSASIGISVFPDDAHTRDELIQASDAAMYEAKQRGKRNFVFYSPELTAHISRYRALEQDLRRGLKENELLLHFQPIISLPSGSVVGVESLLRWQHPERGLLTAGEIIPIAEESGLIVEIGEWALRRACEQICSWRAAGLPQMRVAVNCSVHQLRHRHLLASVVKILAETGMDPELLELEITESAVQHESSCASVLRALKRLGVILAIDDFGTGYSCLSSLKHLPFQRLKIDQSFVRDVTDDTNSAAIAAAVLALGKQLRLHVTAEGVETQGQAEFMQALGCEEVQGYLYSRPVAALAIPDFIASRFMH